MVLVALILVPIAGAVVAWAAERSGTRLTRWVALLACAIDLILAIGVWVQYTGQALQAANSPWYLEFQAPWIPQLGISIHLGLDGLSLLLVALTAFLGLIAVVASWTDIQDRVGFFHFNLLWILGAITGVFLALDLFLFYFFWEMMLIPMYLMIAIWGHERRVLAGTKFFLFTQTSGLLMLVAILGLYFVHGAANGTYTFDYPALLHTAMPSGVAVLLMLGFLSGFAVKLPMFPFHPWLPDAHTQAPTAGSVILAGLMLKTGAYGLIRFVVPLFPQAALAFAPIAMALGAIGILYGALLAFSQVDLKRLIAYTSVSHMGFVLLGVFAWNTIALQGAVLEILAHGLSTGALFVLVGALSERTGTRDMRQMGGLWSTAPRMGGVALVLALASLGLPGLGNFVAEFLILVGAFSVNPWLTALATVGLIVATVYSLWMIQAAFHGPNKRGWTIPDLNRRELAVLGSMILLLLGLGLFPQPVIATADRALSDLQETAAVSAPLPSSADGPTRRSLQ